ncbi:sugar ABC transporter substrate-binding protein [Planomonospora venezuelensis]|uniref:D-xylose transport system substrate-binding protein n=1 Tax=Planomonospora venezuelensis TaxID=1999 RepID=A0A841DJH9_PLAVE|nr:substrate-binding domain-containing protein [Planomonospora venezuelensis]MBB5967286.1 D-xylose transport system substrate-binding protein [Planomonospora venezuelensis]GIM98559.1 solute-binding protein [Planomonospora venezuelensis]
MRRYRRMLAAVTAAVAGTVLAGCGLLPSSGDGGAAGDATAGKAAGRVALLLPERAASRYDAADAPYFSQRLKQLCSTCEIDYRNAGQDADEQLSQAEEALEEGAKVLVLTPVDSAAAAKIVERARERDVPVISYDRLVLGTPVDYYVSFDNAKVGRLQAEALLAALGDKARSGEILWINGSPTDNNATLFKKGAHETLDGKVRIAAEFDTPEWNPDNAKAWTARTLPSLRGRDLIGVYAANDGTAGGAIAALKAAGLPDVPVTGQDAEIAALQRILAGQQHMTVYKAVRLEAEKTAELAFELLGGERPKMDSTVDNGAGAVPSLLLDPVTVTKDTIEETVIKDGYVTPGALCAGAYAEACSAAGIA